MGDLIEPAQLLGPQVALLQTARAGGREPSQLLDMVEMVALTGPKASSLPWWSGMACPSRGGSRMAGQASRYRLGRHRQADLEECHQRGQECQPEEGRPGHPPARDPPSPPAEGS